MAAEQLDTLWEGWMSDLSEGYQQTQDLFVQGKTAEAQAAFRKGVVLPVKKLYSEAAETYPVRFSKVGDWCAWTKDLYILARKIEIAFASGDTAAVKEMLPVLRKHFFDLHSQTGLRKANDEIYAFLVLLDKDQPALNDLKGAEESLEKAELSLKAKAEPDAFNKARDAWSQEVKPILGGAALDKDALERLRTSTKALYNAYGIQFE